MRGSGLVFENTAPDRTRDTKWLVSCPRHDWHVATRTRSLAEAFARPPLHWCPACFPKVT